MPERGYSREIYEGHPYEMKVGWYSYGPVPTSSGAGGTTGKTDANTKTDADKKKDETTHYLALMITKRIHRTKEEIEAAKKRNQTLAEEFSIALPASLIKKAFVAVSYIQKMAGGSLEIPAGEERHEDR
jgi:hypothetical protein